MTIAKSWIFSGSPICGKFVATATVYVCNVPMPVLFLLNSVNQQP
jgi:hypothetical protein